MYKENVDKAVDFYFFDVCVSFRAHPNLTDEEKDREIRAAEQQLDSIKQVVLNVLADNGIGIIQ